MFFPEIRNSGSITAIQNMVATDSSVSESFAHDELFLPLEQAKRKMLDLNIEKSAVVFKPSR